MCRRRTIDWSTGLLSNGISIRFWFLNVPKEVERCAQCPQRVQLIMLLQQTQIFGRFAWSHEASHRLQCCAIAYLANSIKDDARKSIFYLLNVIVSLVAAAVKCRPLQTFHSHWFKHTALQRDADEILYRIQCEKNKIKIFIFTWQKWCRLRIATDFRAIKIAFHILHPTYFHIATPHSSAIERFINIFFALSESVFVYFVSSKILLYAILDAIEMRLTDLST